MAFQTPLDDLATHATGRAIVQIVLEETIKHVHVAEIAKRFAGRAEFDKVVRRSGRRCQQPILHLAHELRDFDLARAIERFEDGRLVPDEADKIIRVKQVQPLVIGDVNT